MVTRRSGLGKGLGALIPPGTVPGNTIDIRERDYQEVAVEQIKPNTRQPRGRIDEEELVPLANSIRELGVLQPLLVRTKTSNTFELIAGERRWRAAMLAGLKTVPVIIRNVKDAQSLEHAIVENLHRKDLNPIDEATAYAQLIDDFSLKQEEVAKRVGRSRSSVTNVMRLLQLPPKVQKLLIAEQISEGHGRALLSVSDEKYQTQVAERIVSEGLSVRAVEDMVRMREELEKPARGASKRSAKALDRGLLEAQEQLTDYLDTRVTMRASRKGGKVIIDFADSNDLSRILGRILEGNDE